MTRGILLKWENGGSVTLHNGSWSQLYKCFGSWFCLNSLLFRMSTLCSGGGWYLIKQKQHHFRFPQNNIIIICNDTLEWKVAACFTTATCVRGGNTAPPADYTWVSANNNTWQCQNKKNTLCLATLFLLQIWVGPPRYLSPLDIPSTSSVTHQIITGTLW